MPGNYYNDNDRFAAKWCRRLITDGHVDHRPIQDVKGVDLEGYIQCHFFCGILGWSEALRLAGWPTEEPVWTASLPCQPFSCAGKGKGEEDPRHLWPTFFRLIQESRPRTIFGEQVPDAIGHRWLDRVFADLEAEAYSCGALVLPAAGAGAPIPRHRIFWVASTEMPVRWRTDGADNGRRRTAEAGGSGITGLMARADSSQLCRIASAGEQPEHEQDAGDYARLASPNCGGCGGRESQPDTAITGDARESNNELVSTTLNRSQVRPLHNRENERERSDEASRRVFWSPFSLVWCRDPKHPDDPERLIPRRIEPGSFPLAHGIPAKVGPLISRLESLGYRPEVAKRIVKLARRNRIGRLRGYGNSISPWIAAVFIRAFMEEAAHA